MTFSYRNNSINKKLLEYNAETFTCADGGKCAEKWKHKNKQLISLTIKQYGLKNKKRKVYRQKEITHFTSTT